MSTPEAPVTTIPTAPAVTVPVTQVKPGLFTTELWLTVLAQVFLTLNSAGIWVYVKPQWVSLVVQGAVIGGYTISRGWAKSGPKLG